MGKVTIAKGAVVGSLREELAVVTPSATPALDASAANVFTYVPDQAATLSVSGGTSGERLTLIVNTSGTSSYTQTFGTGFKSTGTLATGTADVKQFVVSFINDGTNYVETSRTTAQ